MAGNEWINGYLSAILAGGVSDETPLPPLRVKGEFDPARYFVDEVITGTDEVALHRTWIRATAARTVQERSGRMENLCWRIWHLFRKQKEMGWQDTQRMAKRRLEEEQFSRDVLAEELSEVGIVGDSPVSSESADVGTIKLSESRTDMQALVGDQHKEKRLYIVMISLHGLVRGDNMELGKDSDTGGQVKYVVEFAKALANLPEVYRVDLLTRQICSPEVDYSYGEPTEMVTAGSDNDDEEVGQSAGGYIVRIPCGPKDQYLRKELLWPYIQEFVDGALSHILNMARVLGEQIGEGEQIWPHVIHGHYADAGDIASLLSGALNVPMVLTGHSLGRNKLEQLLKQGRQSEEDINATYKIMRRIEAEEMSLDSAELVITSTKQEIDQQWGLYDGFSSKVERALRLLAKKKENIYGLYMPSMSVIAPGMDFSNVVVQDIGDVMEENVDTVAYTGPDGSAVTPVVKPDPPLWGEILRFFTNPSKPMILALARADPKKNIPTLVKAFGEHKPLRQLANLTLIMGNRDDIDELSSGNAGVLMTVLKLIDKYNLYGEISYPKHHKQYEVPDIYRLAAKTKGVFVNPALVEPFGLTLIEAAAHGLPTVATTNGGPVDIQQALHNGLLVDPHDAKAIASALYKLVLEKNLWADCRLNGLKNIHRYSWPEHCKIYLSRVALCRKRHPLWQKDDLDGSEDIESFNDSLQDAQDVSFHLSIDGEKSGAGSVNSSSDIEKMLRSGVLQNGKDSNVEEHLKKSTEKGNEHQHDSNHSSKPERATSLGTTKAASALRKRKGLFVIAVDCYDSAGEPTDDYAQIVRNILQVARAAPEGSSAGFMVSTALTAAECVSFFRKNGLKVSEFDALVCSSGSELFYPITGNENGKESEQLTADASYDNHIDYRWGEGGLRKTIEQMINPSGEFGKKVALEKEKEGNSHCLSYVVKDPSNVHSAEEFRARLRRRGLRCHVVYCRNSSRLHIVPLHASRSQALRYLFVRWGVDISNMTVFVGETGDTDYQELIPGCHKTVILKDVPKEGSENLLHNSKSFHKDDNIPSSSPHIITTEAGYDAEQISAALRKLTQKGEAAEETSVST